MDIDQKQITVIRLHDARGCDINLCKEGEDNYRLQLSAGNNVVNISLGQADVRKICHQILDLESPWAQTEFRYFPGGTRSFYEHMAHLFTRMAHETEKTIVVKRG